MTKAACRRREYPKRWRDRVQRRGTGDRERHESAVTAVYRAGLDDRGFERSEKPVPIPEGTRGALDASGCGSMRTGFFGYEKSKSALTAPAPLFGYGGEAAGVTAATETSLRSEDGGRHAFRRDAAAGRTAGDRTGLDERGRLEPADRLRAQRLPRGRS